MQCLKDTLDLINEVTSLKMEIYRQSFGFLQRFTEKSEKEAQKLPYHINMIDELRANENAHSRILAKLLQQQTPESGKFEILESFVRYLKERPQRPDSFSRITVQNPNVTQETGRIDLWIRDKGQYAIIVENKIHWARDQHTKKNEHILPEKNGSSPIWKYFDRYAYGEAFGCLQNVLQILAK